MTTTAPMEKWIAMPAQVCAIGGIETLMRKQDRIMVLGHRGLIGSAVVRKLKARGCENIIIVPRAEVDLTNATETEWMFSAFNPDYVFFCAAKVGGVKANMDQPLEFFLDNMRMETNVITSAAKYKTRKLLFLGSSCIYPRNAPQPLKPESLLTGLVDKATEPYALAKILGIRLCQWHKLHGHNFISAMPCNVYGPGDNYNPVTSHCVPGLIRRMHDAMVEGAHEFKVWGFESVQREVIFSDDCADALITLMESYSGFDPVNAGSGDEVTIASMAKTIAQVIGYHGSIVFDNTKPVGVLRKIMDSSVLRSLGWYPKTSFFAGLSKTYESFLTNSSRLS